MIVKIWPIRADYAGEPGKDGGMESLKNAVDYIADPEKVTAPYDDARQAAPYSKADVMEGEGIQTERDFHRVISYMANEDKTEATYVSTYLCEIGNVTQDFRTAAEILAVKSGFKVDPYQGAMAYHMVQAFPENLDITNDEVHECGLDLVRKLGKYQALICTHVNPVQDEKGDVHGRTKHNHILLNAYVHPDFYNPEKGGPGKYNDCLESYRQLQVYNDEIAIEHGLPIIRQGEMERTYNWTESKSKNRWTSWKERTRMDIDMCRRAARDWDDFVKIMAREGYTIREKKHITYVTPDDHAVRGATLGNQFTKESLNLYWAMRDHTKDMIKRDLESDDEPILSDFVYQYKGKLSVRIPIGPQFVENRQFAYIPLSKDTKADEEALRSYMAMDRRYDICNENGQPVTAASGIEILRSIEDLKDEGRMKYRAQKRMEEAEIREERRQREAAKFEEEQKKKAFYPQRRFKNSRTGRTYRSELYDENGRRRSSIEMIFVLALIVLNKESYLWALRDGVPEEHENELFFASTNKKIQHMVDTLELCRQEEVETVTQLQQRLEIVGAECSRAKKAYYNTARAAERMETLADAVKTYRETSQIATSINALPEGEEKTRLQEEYADEINRFKSAKRVMYINGITEEGEITDFEQRYSKICADVEELEKRMKDAKERYRRLKKLEYGLQQAQDPQFIHGPTYPAVKQTKQSEEQKTPVWEQKEVVLNRREQIEAPIEPEREADKRNGKEGPELGQE